jgi:transcriptional regulator of arginine metabolism
VKEKVSRLKAIYDIIQRQRINSQEALLRAMQSLGFNLTQATLSRDLKELKAVKQYQGEADDYVYIIPESSEEVFVDQANVSFPLSEIVSVAFSGNICVIRTRPAFANGIAILLDKARHPEFLGTIAGDDTIMLVVREKASGKKVKEALKQVIPGIQNKFYNA